MFYSELIASLVLITAALLARKIVPAVLEKRDGSASRIRYWVEGAFPPIMYLLVTAAACSAVTAFFLLLHDEAIRDFGRVLEKLPSITEKITRIAATVFIGWAVIGANQRHSFFLPYNKQDADVSRQALLRFVSALLSLVVAAFVVVIVVTELGYNVSGLVTGLGLGGLTFALAAKDATANFFGGAVLVAERPFEIGDYIETDVVSGTVVDINMRTTAVRTSSGAKTVVPNATLSGNAITNWTSGIARRRIEMDLTFEYTENTEAFKAFTEGVREMLIADPEIDLDGVNVRFFELGTYGLRIKLICYARKPLYSEYLRIRERQLYEIIALAKEQGLIFAFPALAGAAQGKEL